MIKGGILEGFPAYLFGSDSKGAATLIIDDPALGRLNLSPVPGDSRMIIVVSSDKAQLENTQEALAGLDIDNIQLVLAAPGHYPFCHRSVGTILSLASGKRATQRYLSTEIMPPEFSRILSADGCVIELDSGRTVSLTDERPVIDQWPNDRSYFIRPSSGEHYFVTREGTPTSEALGHVQHGRLRALRIKAKALLNRPGKASFHDSVRVAIYSPAHCQLVIERLVEIAEQIEPNTMRLSSLDSFGLFVKVDWNAFLLAGSEDGTITKLPLRGDVLTKMGDSSDTLDELQTIENTELQSVLPEVMGYGAICGQAYWIEKRIEGTPVTKLWWKPSSSRQAVGSAFQFLVNLQLSTAYPTQIDHQIFNTLVNPQVESVETRVRQDDPEFDLETFQETLWDLFKERQIALVRTHGDLWLGNLLVSDDGQLVGVLDWDLSKEKGWPLIDLLHLLTFQQKWLAVWHFGRLVTWKLLPRRMSNSDDNMIEQYCASLSIEDDLWPGFVALYWLHRAAQVVEVFDSAWFHRNVVNPLPNIIETLHVG